MSTNELVIFNDTAAKVAIFVKTLKEIKVADAPTAQLASSQLREAKVLSDSFEDLRKSYVDPMNQKVKLANTFVKERVAPLLAGMQHIKSELAAWELKLHKEREETKKKAEQERLRLEEEARVAAAKPVNEAPAAPADEWEEGVDLFANAPATISAPEAELADATREIEHQATMASIAHQHKQTVKAADANKVKGARRVWKHKLIDIKLVPEEYTEKFVDDFKVRSLIRDTEDPSTLKIPGLEFYEDITITAGRR